MGQEQQRPESRCCEGRGCCQAAHIPNVPNRQLRFLPLLHHHHHHHRLFILLLLLYFLDFTGLCVFTLGHVVKCTSFDSPLLRQEKRRGTKSGFVFYRCLCLSGVIKFYIYIYFFFLPPRSHKRFLHILFFNYTVNERIGLSQTIVDGWMVITGWIDG